MEPIEYYSDVNDSNFFENIKEKENLILVKFDAEWSGPCHIIEPILEKLSFEFKNKVKFLKIDVDRNLTTKNEYGISKVPTLLFFKDGQILDHVEGAVPEKIIIDKLTKLLHDYSKA